MAGPKKVLGTRQRASSEMTLREEVSEYLRAHEAAQQQAAAEQAALAEEVGGAELAELSRERFRHASRAEIEEAGMNLARRLRRESDPTPAEVRAGILMIMDAEDQRRILFEQRSGVRTPSPHTGLSSLDDPQAMERLQKRTGAGGPGRGFLENIRQFYAPGSMLDMAVSGSRELHARRAAAEAQVRREAEVEAEAARVGRNLRIEEGVRRFEEDLFEEAAEAEVPPEEEVQ